MAAQQIKKKYDVSFTNPHAQQNGRRISPSRLEETIGTATVEGIGRRCASEPNLLEKLKSSTTLTEEVTVGLNQFVQRTTIHGLQDAVFAPNRKVKALWVFTMLAVLVALSYQVSRVIMEYASEPTATLTTTTSIEEFPLITYCSTGWADLEKIRKRKLSFETFAYIVSVLPSSFKLYDFVPEWDLQSGSRMAAREIQNFEELMRENNHNMTNLLLSLAADADASVKNISEKNQLQYNVKQVPHGLGVCYEVLALGMKSVSHIVNEPALHLSLPWTKVWLRSNPDVTENCRRSKWKWFGIGEGFSSFFSGKFVSTSSLSDYSVFLRGLQLKKLNRKKSPCRAYTEKDRDTCVKRCQVSGGSNPNCTLYQPGLEFPRSTHFCSFLIERSPLSRIREVTGLANVATGACGKTACPIPCARWIFSATIAMETYRHTKGVEQNNSIFKFVLQSSKEVLKIEEYKTYSLYTVFANVGGTVSILCGASVLSIIQLGYICCYRRSKGEQVKV